MDALEDLVGTSPAIAGLRRRLGRLLSEAPAARHGACVLLRGEEGTGKSLLARLIHLAGPRRAGPFVNVSCAAVPASISADELFMPARGGTLYLDEVALLPEALQAELAALIEGQVGRTRIDPDEAIRVIAGSSTDLAGAVRAGRFPDDLSRRLAATALDLPPLRDRGRDVLALAERYLQRFARDYATAPKRLDRSARAALLEHQWPGNVRELVNVVERAVLVTDAQVVGAAALGLPLEPGTPSALGRPALPPASFSRAEVHRRHLEAALQRTGWNIARTAALLGLARNTVYAHIQKYDLGHVAARPTTARRARPLPRSAPAVDTRLRWERRSVTLLRGEIERSHGPGAVAHAGAALEILVEKVETFGARVEELTPAGIVAAFGLHGVDDAPRRAAHAALAVHKAVERSRADGRPIPRVRIAVHAALMLVGRRGASVSIDADAGRAEGRGLQRLLGVAAPGDTVVSAGAAPLLRRRFELVPIGDGAGEVSRLAGPERRGLDVWGSLTPFVGRRAELGALQTALARVRAGGGEAVLLVGEAGVGKSRVMWELSRSPSLESWHVLEMRCVPFARAAAEHPVAGLLRAHFGIERAAGAAQARARVVAGLRALDDALEPIMPGLCSWLEIPVEDAGWQVLDLPERRRAAIDAVTRLLLAQSAVRPVLLIVEDLHWVDSETDGVLERLLAGIAEARVCVAATLRDGFADPWRRHSPITRIELPPLPPGEAGRMLRRLVGDHPTLPAAKRLVAEAAEGNPFFLEESVRTLVETGALIGERGRYRAVGPITRVGVPGTVEELLARRIDRLGAGDRQVLRYAAAIGREVPLDVLAAVADAPGAPLAPAIERLVAAELLYRTRTSDGPACGFKHALIRETAYRSLADHERPDLHQRILVALETLPHRDHSDDIERLAHHAQRAEAWDKAVGYLRQAGDRAFRRWANQEAEERFTQALAALEHWPAGRPRAELAIDLRLSLRDPLWTLGKMDDMRRRLEEARAMAESIGDARRLGWVLCHLARLDWATAEHPGALANGQRALGIAAEIGDGALAIETRFYVAVVVLAMGDARRATAMLRENLVALEDPKSVLPRRFRVQGPVLHRVYLSRCLAEVGQHPEAVAAAEIAWRLADVSGNPFSRVGARFALGNARLREGRPGDAITPLESARALSAEYELENWKPAVLSTLGAAYAGAGRVEEGRRLIEDAVRYSEASHILSGHSMWLVYLGEALLRGGRRDEAMAEGLRARQLARVRDERGFEAWAIRLLGAVAEETGDMRAAAEWYRQALDAAVALDMRPLAERCRAEMARSGEDRR
jgi:tetratricopeptide (TPR) repeat protein